MVNSGLEEVLEVLVVCSGCECVCVRGVRGGANDG
jgi:hypothetical protein